MGRQYCEYQNDDNKLLRKKVAESFMNQTAKNWTYWFDAADVEQEIESYKKSLTEHQLAQLDFGDNVKTQNTEQTIVESAEGPKENNEKRRRACERARERERERERVGA